MTNSPTYVHMSDREYKDAIEILNRSSQHVNLIAGILEQRVLQQGSNGSLLDVGAGPGFLTKALAKHFDRVVAVEPNHAMEDFYRGTPYETHFTRFQDFALSEKFDLVMCNHVLYHMPEAEMKVFIEKLMSHVKDGGHLFICLMGAVGQNHDLQARFNPTYVHSGAVKQVLSELGLVYSLETRTNKFSAHSESDYRSLLKFMILEGALGRSDLEKLSGPARQALEDQIRATLEREHSTLTLEQSEDYFILTKDAAVKGDATQYDKFAETYSNTFAVANKKSISAYFSQIDFNLRGARLLDMGCGDGSDLRVFGKEGAVLSGVDASEEMVKLATARNPGADIKVGRFEALPFPDGHFDVVVSKWAIQTSPEIEPIYKEVARVLKPNGAFLFLACHPIRQFLEKKKHPKDYFKKEMVESILFGGKVVVQEPSHTMNEYLSPFFFEHFRLQGYFEGFDDAIEMVEGDTYPGFSIFRASRK